MLPSEYLSKKLTPYPLPTKDGGVLRTIDDARGYKLAMPKRRKLRAPWKHAWRLLLEEAGAAAFTHNRSRFIRRVPAKQISSFRLVSSRHIRPPRHRSRQPAIAVLPVIQIDHRLQLLVRNSIKKGKCRPRDAFE